MRKKIFSPCRQEQMFSGMRMAERRRANEATDLQDVVPHGGAAALDVEVRVAVLHADQTVFGDFGFPQQGVVGPVVLHPGQAPHYLRTLYDGAHPGEHRETRWSGLLQDAAFRRPATQPPHLVSENSRLITFRTFFLLVL